MNAPLDHARATLEKYNRLIEQAQDIDHEDLADATRSLVALRDGLQNPSVADPNIEIMESNAYRNEVTGGWRLALRFKRQDDKKPGELRAFLRNARSRKRAS